MVLTKLTGELGKKDKKNRLFYNCLLLLAWMIWAQGQRGNWNPNPSLFSFDLNYTFLWRVGKVTAHSGEKGSHVDRVLLIRFQKKIKSFNGLYGSSNQVFLAASLPDLKSPPRSTLPPLHLNTRNVPNVLPSQLMYTFFRARRLSHAGWKCINHAMSAWWRSNNPSSFVMVDSTHHGWAPRLPPHELFQGCLALQRQRWQGIEVRHDWSTFGQPVRCHENGVGSAGMHRSRTGEEPLPNLVCPPFLPKLEARQASEKLPRSPGIVEILWGLWLQGLQNAGS